MHLACLECDGFRCLKDIRFEPVQGVNVIRGKNAQGKTSVLEAILFAATSKSHRTTNEHDLAARGGEGFRIALRAQREDRDVSIEANWFKGAKRFKVNGVAQTRVSHVLGKIGVVLFSPEDIALVKGAASARRKFMDMELSQLRPQYLTALQRYRHALRQRNELLRTNRLAEDVLDVWDEQLAREGTVLIGERAAFAQALQESAGLIYGQIASGETLEVKYEADVPLEKSLLDALKAGRNQDVRQGKTGKGPHRDDLDLTIAGRPARHQASQGQQKTAALALKLAELKLAHRHTGEYPILMLDEVVAELDVERAAELFRTIDGGVQVILTTTETGRKPPTLPVDSTDFLIEAGRFVPPGP